MPLAPTLRASAAAWCAAAALAGLLCGCRNLAEQRAVNGFAAALRKDDPAALRALASADFGDVALRDGEAIDDVKRLWPAKGDLKVVEIKEVEADDRRDPEVPEKLVTVEDERGWKTDHRLVRDPKSKTWVVDEVFISQQQKGLKATRTVSEQVAFLNVVRSFVDAWKAGDRDARLAGMTDACRKELEPLPDEVLDHLGGRMFPNDAKFAKPEATMDEDIAIVRLRRPASAVLIQMKRVDGEWLVDDAAAEGGKGSESVPSLRKTAVAYAAAAEFLDAYAAADRERLRNAAAKRFFDETLKSADLSKAPLPKAAEAKSGELKVAGKQAELVLTSGDRVVRLDLVRSDDVNDVDARTEFRVEDVTLFERGGTIQKRVAAVLLAEPLANLYADALVARDLGRLKVLASHDFAERVWRQVTPALLAELPLDEVRPGERKALSVVYDGAVTEVTLLQGETAMTVILRDETGALRVDDVKVAAVDRPHSLKTTLAHMLPVARLRASLAARDLAAVREECTTDFNRLIWTQVRHLPPTAAESVRFLDGPLTALAVNEGTVTVRLGDPGYGGVVTLVEERGRYRVNDVLLIAGPGPQDQALLKPLLRKQLSDGTILADRPAVTAEAEGGIVPVGYEVEARGPASANVPAQAGAAGPPAEMPLDDAGFPATGDAESVAAPFNEPLR